MVIGLLCRSGQYTILLIMQAVMNVRNDFSVPIKIEIYIATAYRVPGSYVPHSSRHDKTLLCMRL